MSLAINVALTAVFCFGQEVLPPVAPSSPVVAASEIPLMPIQMPPEIAGEYRIPEVVMSISDHCQHAMQLNWRLSSNAIPATITVIPLVPLVVEVRVDQPVDFVELTMDGKPLPLPADNLGGPLVYDLRCPSPGRHFLQARYLRGNRWSGYSPPLHFEVRLPEPPKIMAIASGSQQPISLARNQIAKITHDSIKIRLADVGPMDHIVAYVDGQELATCDLGEPCCRMIHVQGKIAPGVHSLSIRRSHCHCGCAPMSEPSNVVSFHYYQAEHYLLRPGADCYNQRPRSKCKCDRCKAQQTNENECARSGVYSKQFDVGSLAKAFSSVDSHLSTVGRIVSPNLGNLGKTTELLLFSGLALGLANPTAVSDHLVTDSTKFRDLIVKAAGKVTDAADIAISHSQAARSTADTALRERDDALNAFKRAENAAHSAEAFKNETNRYAHADLEKTRAEARALHTDAQAALNEARSAYLGANEAARLAQEQTVICQTRAMEATASREIAAELVRRANVSLEKAKVAAADARLRQSLGHDDAAADARDAVQNELSGIKQLLQRLDDLVASSAGQAQAAAQARRMVEEHRMDAKRQRELAQSAAQRAESHASAAKHAADTASTLTMHMQHPAYVAAIANLKASESSFSDASKAAAEAAKHANVADAAATSAETTAKTARINAGATAQVIHDSQQCVTETRILAEKAIHDAAKPAPDADEKCDRDSMHAARVARRAIAKIQATYHHAQEAQAAYDEVLRMARQADHQAGIAEKNALFARQSADKARDEAKLAAQERDVCGKLAADARTAANQLLEAVRTGNSPASQAASNAAEHAKTNAEQAALRAANRLRNATIHSRDAAKFEATAKAASGHTQKIIEAGDAAKKAKQSAADPDLRMAGYGEDDLIEDAREDLDDAWRKSEKAAALAALEERTDRAAKSTGDVDLQWAVDQADAAETQALRDELKANARIREAQAKERSHRANKVDGPSSPFYFASVAHFPLRDFGINGEIVDRPGLIIYEDMELNFDRDGNYTVRFRATPPNMPTTLRLQFQIQPYENGPWHTITLPPIQFKFPPTRWNSHGAAENPQHDDECCDETHKCICRGKSEILRRCYAEMGDSAQIRRAGKATFGFGIAATSF